MDYRCISDIKEFSSLAGDWDEALINSGEDNPFLLSDFILIWWKYYCHKRKLLIFAVFDKGRIVYGIPMCITRKKMRNILEHLGGCAANLTHPFSINKNFNSADYLFASLDKNKDWDILVLERVLENNPFIGQIEESLNSDSFVGRLRYTVTENGFNGLIDLSKGYDSVLGNLPRRLCRYLESSKEKARLMGGLSFKRIQGKTNIRQLFKQYREISIGSFALRNSVSAFKNNTYNNFFGELLETLELRGRLDAHKLTLSDKTLAISFAYRFGKGFKWILTAFNPDFYKLRPGHLLVDALILEAITKGDPYFDMYYGGDLFYKQQWCNKMIPLRKIMVYRNNFLNRSFLWIDSTLRSSKVLMNSAKKIKEFIKR